MAHDVLIVDDEADICMLIAGILQDEGYTTREAANGEDGIEQVKAKAPNLVILDIWMEHSRIDGLEALSAIRAMRPSVPIIVISGHGTIETAVKAIKLGAYEFIEKPFESDRLLLVVERAIEAAQLKRENRELKLRAGQPEELIGSCAAIEQIRRVIGRVGPTGSRVLITGPGGSGKEVVARQIHLHSVRAKGPFVVANCASMDPDRLQDTLFGGVSGRDRLENMGLLAQSEGGTLVLDEVADMPSETQGRIVRILQELRMDGATGHGPVEIDVRVIATSNRNLKQEIKEGRFREELYYRLSVVPVEVPPLQERMEDIPELARYFIAKSAKDAGLPSRPLAEDAIAALQTYVWPGNVRQLRNVMDWLLIMIGGSSDEPVRADMLPPYICNDAPQMLRLERSDEIITLPLRDAREMFEREYLTAQIVRYGGNISRTAAFVGMERSALHRKLKLLGVKVDQRIRK